MSANYYIGPTYDDALGNAPRYFYALRRNSDGELYFVRSDQVKDRDAIELNEAGDPNDNFEEFEVGVDFLDGISPDHEAEYANLKYTQYRWDNRSFLYYVDANGFLVQRINQGYSYPDGISS